MRGQAVSCPVGIKIETDMPCLNVGKRLDEIRHAGQPHTVQKHLAFIRSNIPSQPSLRHTNGRRRDAAVLLGWGRNTLTRKIKELNMGNEEDASDNELGEQ